MGSDEIKVYVVANKGYPCYRLRWKDPATGKKVYRTSGIRRDGGKKARKKASEAAGALASDLNAGRVVSARGMTWADFRTRYEEEIIPGLAVNTGIKVAAVFNTLESLLPTVKEGRLRELTAERISTFQAKMREKGKSESTIAGYLAHLRSALHWAADASMIPALPKFPRIRRAKAAKATSPMKGRPITGEEFDRMIRAVPAALARIGSLRTRPVSIPRFGRIW